MNLYKERPYTTIDAIFVAIDFILIAIWGFNTYSVGKRLKAQIKTIEERDIETNKKIDDLKKHINESICCSLWVGESDKKEII